MGDCEWKELAGVGALSLSLLLTSRGGRGGPGLRGKGQEGRGGLDRMTLWTLVQGILLVANGLAVLNEQRFLEKYGLGPSVLTDPYASKTSLRVQVSGFLSAVQYLRVPLILVNAVVILVKIVFG